MANHELYADAGSVSAEGGDVSSDGPDCIAMSLTPKAALETGGRLIDAAAVAAGQRHGKAPGHDKQPQ